MTRVRSAVFSALAVAFVILVWTILTESRIISSRVLVSPIAIYHEFVRIGTEGYLGTSLLTHLLASVSRSTVGLICGVSIGVPVGLAVGYSQSMSAILSPFLAILRPIPVIAYIPLAILWFGIGEFSKIALIGLTSFLYMTINAAAGVRSVPGDLLRAAQSLGASKLQLFANVMLPACLPFLFAGLRVAAGISWAVLVSAELIAAQEGLGYLIMDAATFFRLPAVYVGIILIGTIGFGIDRLISLAEGHFVHWNRR